MLYTFHGKVIIKTAEIVREILLRRTATMSHASETSERKQHESSGQRLAACSQRCVIHTDINTNLLHAEEQRPVVN